MYHELIDYKIIVHWIYGLLIPFENKENYFNICRPYRGYQNIFILMVCIVFGFHVFYASLILSQILLVMDSKISTPFYSVEPKWMPKIRNRIIMAQVFAQ